MVTFLLNDSQGNLVDSTNSLFSSGPPPERIFANRIQVADFNGDSADDLIIGTMGVVGRECLGEPPAPVKEPFLLILSDGNGGMVDASNQIEGQEDGGPPDNKDFAHDLAVGDIDGDGDQDFYSAKFLFLNDGRGNFQNASWMLPRALRSIGGVLASAMGDLDGDHVDDLVVLPFEGVGNKNHVFLSSGASSLAEYRHIELPEGLFGANTKSLDTIIRDFDQDGRNDIMVTQTQADPYYRGRALQLLTNKGDGVFADESDRISGYFSVEGPGPSNLFFVDLNGDGFRDIVEMNGWILINDGTGRYQQVTSQELPSLDYTDLTQYQSDEFEDDRQHGLLFPIQLDNEGLPAFVDLFRIPFNVPNWPRQPGDKDEAFLYTITPSAPYQPSPLQPQPRIDLSATEFSFAAPVGVNPAAQQITIANSGSGNLEWSAMGASEGNWLGVSPGEGAGQSSLTVAVRSEGLPAGVYEGSISVQAAGAANNPQIVSVRLTVGSPVFTSESFVNAASYATGRFASEMWVALFGQNLADRLILAGGNLPTSLGGVSISITDSQGVRRPAKLQFVHPEHINFLLPAGLALGPAVVEVTNAPGETASATLQIEAAAPGIFSANASGRGPAAATFLRVEEDGTRAEGFTFDATAPAGSRTNIVLERGSNDEVYLSFFGTGFRHHSSVSVEVRNLDGNEIAGTNGMEVLGAVAQGQFEGLDQAVIGPLNWFYVAGSGEIDIVFTFDGVESNTVTIHAGDCPESEPWTQLLPGGCD